MNNDSHHVPRKELKPVELDQADDYMPGGRADRDKDGIDDEDEQTFENIDRSKYYGPGDNALKRIYESVLKTLAGENGLGRALGKAKDLARNFVPLGAQIDDATDAIGDALKPKQKMTVMNKSPLLSKTVWSAIIIALTAVLNALGVDFGANPELVGNIYEIIFGLAGALGLYGLREAVATELKTKVGG